MGNKTILREADDERKSLEQEIIDQLDGLIHRAKTENSVLRTVLSKLNEPAAILLNKDNTTHNLELITALGSNSGSLSLPGTSTDKSDKSAKKTKPSDDLVVSSTIEDLINAEAGADVWDFISKYTVRLNGSTHVASTTTRFNIDKLVNQRFKNIINLKRINDVRRINKFFHSVNAKLPNGGLYFCNFETYSNRKARILKKSFYPLNWLHYTLDVIVTRVFPKVPVTKNIYFAVSKGRNRVLSKAETFGRLYSSGFEIIDEKFIGDHLHIVAQKVGEPINDRKPTYGPIIRLKRHGKDGKLFNVYKLRTMHAFSEYLQEYVYQHNDLQEGGKFSNDFRITTEGKLFRKFWVDELPMFINLLKGNMKLVGVRPLSSHYFNLYTEELREKRTKYKPGLIPPFYADLPKSLDEIIASEMRYLEAYEKNPISTDISYFFKAWNNILFKRARSN